MNLVSNESDFMDIATCVQSQIGQQDVVKTALRSRVINVAFLDFFHNQSRSYLLSGTLFQDGHLLHLCDFWKENKISPLDFRAKKALLISTCCCFFPIFVAGKLFLWGDERKEEVRRLNNRHR